MDNMLLCAHYVREKLLRAYFVKKEMFHLKVSWYPVLTGKWQHD